MFFGVGEFKFKPVAVDIYSGLHQNPHKLYSCLRSEEAKALLYELIALAEYPDYFCYLSLKRFGEANNIDHDKLVEEKDYLVDIGYGFSEHQYFEPDHMGVCWNFNPAIEESIQALKGAWWQRMKRAKRVAHEYFY